DAIGPERHHPRREHDRLATVEAINALLEDRRIAGPRIDLDVDREVVISDRNQAAPHEGLRHPRQRLAATRARELPKRPGVVQSMPDLRIASEPMLDIGMQLAPLVAEH